MRKEDVEQIKVFIQINQWIKDNPDKFHWSDFYHTANERQTSAQEGIKLKRMGVRRGVPDIFVSLPRKGHYGLYVELKAEGGRLTKEQKEFLERKRETGYKCAVCWGAEEALAVIKEYVF